MNIINYFVLWFTKYYLGNTFACLIKDDTIKIDEKDEEKEKG